MMKNIMNKQITCWACKMYDHLNCRRNKKSIKGLLQKCTCPCPYWTPERRLHVFEHVYKKILKDDCIFCIGRNNRQSLKTLKKLKPKQENHGYYVTEETLLKTDLTHKEAREVIRNYKGKGLVHMKNDV